MATNPQGTRPTNRSSESTTVDTTPSSTTTSTGAGSVGSVAVYDQDADGTTSHSARPSASMVDDRNPVETRSSGSMMTWIISAIVLIVLAYFLLQMIF